MPYFTLPQIRVPPRAAAPPPTLSAFSTTMPSPTLPVFSSDHQSYSSSSPAPSSTSSTAPSPASSAPTTPATPNFASNISWPLAKVCGEKRSVIIPEPTWGKTNEERFKAWPDEQWEACVKSLKGAESVIELFQVKLKTLAKDKKRANSKLGQEEKQKIKYIINENRQIVELNEPFAIFASTRRHYFAHERAHLLAVGEAPENITEARIASRITEGASSAEERDWTEMQAMRGVCIERGFGLGIEMGGRDMMLEPMRLAGLEEGVEPDGQGEGVRP